MANSCFRTVVSCPGADVITVGGQWFYAMAVYAFATGRRILIVTKETEDSPYVLGLQVLEGEPHELFPGVHITFTQASKPEKLKVRIKAPKGMPLHGGYPPAQAKPRVFTPISQVPGLKHLAG